jgi:hypothetical protein
MRTLEIQLPMCGLTWPVPISTIYLSILSSISIRWSLTTPPTWSAYRGGLVALAATLLHLKSAFSLPLMRFSAGLLRVYVHIEKRAWV